MMKYWPAITAVCWSILSCAPAASAAAESEPAGAYATAKDIAELRALILKQQREIDELRQALGTQAKDIKLAPVSFAPPSAPPVNQSTAETEVTPPYLRIGDAYISPVGFVDFTNVWRSTNPGSGIGTNFGSIPFSNTIPQGKIGEERMSLQNSRVGARVDALVKGAHVTGYWESDFLGSLNATTNVAVSSNSDVFRLRLFWVDVRKNRWEVLGGQSWSMMTPGRTGISALPSDIFYSQDMDVNYQAGLVWSRQPQFRLLYHPSASWTAAVSFEAPEQYIGGSSGGGAITLPAALATPYAPQLDNGATTLSAPNAHPDIVAKVAFDYQKRFHFELGGVLRSARVYDPLLAHHTTAAGGGVEANLNFTIAPGFRILTNNYWSDGGGRYIFGQAPDLVVRADGTLSLVHSASTVSGFEWTIKNTLVYGYYGGIYIGRNAVVDTTGKFAGYGYPGAPAGQNRSIQEGSFGLIQTFWKDARYGALSLITQYSYLTRSPWAIATGAPASANTNMLFLDLRYTLPGAAPSLK